MSNVVGLRGALIPTGEPNPAVVAVAEKLLALAMSGEIIGIQAVLLHGDTICASLMSGGSVSYSVVGMLHCAANDAIEAMRATE